MKKVVFIGITFLSLFLFAFNTKAATCDEKIMNDAKSVIAVPKVVEIQEYGYDVTRFRISVKNLTSDMYAKINLCDTEVRKYTKKDNSSIFPLFELPCSTSVYVYSNGKACDKDVLLAKGKLAIPEYNPYSKRPICKKYKDYKYCQETFDEAMDLYNEVEPKIEALEKKDPRAAKASKASVIIEKINKKFNLTNTLLIVSLVLGFVVVVIVVISVIMYRKKTRK